MTIEEMFRLQGMSHTKFIPTMSDVKLGQQIDNSMSVNVLARLSKQILKVTFFKNIGDLMDSDNGINVYKEKDRWESGQGLKELKNSIGHKWKHDPRAKAIRNYQPTDKEKKLPKERVHRTLLSS